jgi:hypothetical protein
MQAAVIADHNEKVDVDRAPAPQFWLWPNLLSLDAPVVAILWQILFARCFQAQAGVLPAVLLLSTVWLIYSADRTFDAWRGDRCSPRHEFYRRHWRGVMPVWVAVLLLTAWLATTRLPEVLFRRGLILLVVVVAYFAFVHLGKRCWPKEAAVGLVFALGATLAAWGSVKTVADMATILVFSCLCWINCVAIQRWERERLDWSPVIVAMGVAFAACALLYLSRPILGAAEMASAFGFLLLDRVRRRLSADAVRVLADVALLSPLLFLPLVPR